MADKKIEKNMNVEIFLANGVKYDVFYSEEIEESFQEELENAMKGRWDFFLGNWTEDHIEVHCEDYDGRYLFRLEDGTIPARQIIGYRYL